MQWQIGTLDAHPNAGAELGFAPPGASVNVAPGQRITEKWNCGVSGSASVYKGVGPSGQFGYGGYDTDSFRGRGSYESLSFFWEVGVSVSPAPFSLYETCYYVFPSVKSLLGKLF
jgi:hypothetical protein